MTAPRRHGDPDYLDYSKERNGFSVQLPFGLGTVAGKGWLSIVAIMLVGAFLTVGGFAYITWEGFQALGADHKSLLNANDRLACVLSMSDAERKEYRQGHMREWPCFWLR